MTDNVNPNQNEGLSPQELYTLERLKEEKKYSGAIFIEDYLFILLNMEKYCLKEIN